MMRVSNLRREYFLLVDHSLRLIVENLSLHQSSRLPVFNSQGLTLWLLDEVEGVDGQQNRPAPIQLSFRICMIQHLMGGLR